VVWEASAYFLVASITRRELVIYQGIRCDPGPLDTV
jgi:hypothetical protein